MAEFNRTAFPPIYEMVQSMTIPMAEPAAPSRRFRTALTLLGCVPLAGLLNACALAPSGGPSSAKIRSAQNAPVGGSEIMVVDLNGDVAAHILANDRASAFADDLGDGIPFGSLVGLGDVLDVSIWEAPPAALFGAVGGDLRTGASASGIRLTTLPDQVVNGDGAIVVPFAGRVPVVGRTPAEIAGEVTRRLAGKANQPQVVVRVTGNSTNTVTVVGDGTGSARVPISARGERVLDALAAAGGVKQPVGKVTIQITRGDRLVSMPLKAIIEDPRQNIRLQRDDVVTALFQPYSFTALGATSANAEVPFEATGLTLSQALGRVAGIQDQRANPAGVFIFRMEDEALVRQFASEAIGPSVAGKVPVIYRVNLRDPGTYFLAQNFQMRNKDILYASNAPLADFQKFLNIVSSAVVPVVTIKTATE